MAYCTWKRIRFRLRLKNVFRNISATHTWRVVDKKLLISHVHTKCNPTSDFSAKALDNCENLGIKYVQQSESAIKHRIYPGIASNILKNVTRQFTHFRTLRTNVGFYMKRDFLAIRFLRPTLSKVVYSSGCLLFISYSFIRFWIDWERVHEYTKSRTCIREKLHDCQRAKTR